MRKIKWLAILFGLLVLVPEARGQYEDTALWRKFKVKEVISRVNFLQFENSNDTCLFETKQVDQNGLVTSLKQNYHCHGWGIVAETRMQYDEKNRINYISAMQNDQVASNTKLWYDEEGRVRREEIKTFEPYATTIISHRYFGKVGSPDSMLTTQVINGDTAILRTSYTYEGGKQIRAEVVDITHAKPVSKRVNKYDKRGNLVRDEFILMQSYEDDEITLISYDSENRITRSESELHKTAAEFYYQDSLLRQTFYYNKFGTLERKVFHQYTFWE